MKVARITEAIIQATKIPEGERKIELRDQEVKGFILELTAAGRGTYALRSKDSNGKQRCLKIGVRPVISLAEARARAIQLKAEVQLGADPHKEKQAQKEVPTLRVFVEEQYLPYIKPRKRSYKDDENRLRQHILPRFGERKMNSITRKEIVDFHSDLRALGLAPATCDRFLSLFRYALNLAKNWGVITNNPATEISLFLEPNEVENYLNDEQLSRLLAVLQTYHNRPVAQLFLFLLSTGSRLNEAMTATWEQLDIAQATWRIPASISKSKRVRSIPLNATALKVLEEQQPDSSKRSGRVFVKAHTGEPIKSVQRAWESIRKSAGVDFLRLHDLRHQYASMLVNAGRSLYEVQQVLGHSSPMVTQRYAHLTTRTLQDAAATAATRIDSATPKLLPAPGATPASSAS